MKITVLFFGVLKDLAGKSGESVNLAEGSSVRDLLFHYAGQRPEFDPMMKSVAIAVNQEYSGLDRALREGDEVGLLPPVSGGSGGSDKNRDRENDAPEVRIVHGRIDADAIVARLKKPSDGAVVVFDGIVRDNTRGRRTVYLNYESYEAMALKQMESLAQEARTHFAVRGVAIVHRLGRLEIGETSVLIAVASAHRGAAFEASQWIIDTLKKTVTIWKKEYFEDGAVWADGEPYPEEIRLPGAK
jgi:MoaE-MoaD fusion protein